MGDNLRYCPECGVDKSSERTRLDNNHLLLCLRQREIQVKEANERIHRLNKTIERLRLIVEQLRGDGRKRCKGAPEMSKERLLFEWKELVAFEKLIKDAVKEAIKAGE